MDRSATKHELMNPVLIQGRRLRICVVAPYGSASYIVESSKALQMFSDVWVITFDPEGVDGWVRVNRHVRTQVSGGLRYLLISPLKLRPGRVFWRLNARIKMNAIRRAMEVITDQDGEPDVVHGHFYPTALPLLNLLRDKSTLYVHTEHSSALIRRYHGPSRVGEGVIRRILQEADAVMAVSSSVRHALEQRGGRRIHVVPNAVDTSLFQPGANTTHSDGVTLISVGRLEIGKGHDALIRSIASLREESDLNLRLVIVGEGPERAQLEWLSRSRGLEDVVTMKGFVPHEEVADVLRMADAYVHASSFETFSVALLEAQMVGLPVVAVRSGGLTDSIAKWQGESVPSADPTVLKDGISRCLGRLHTFDRDAISAWAGSKYGRLVVAARLREVYEELLRD